MKVNFVDLPKQYERLKQDILYDFDTILKKGAFMGASGFEKAFADYHGVDYCVGVGSGTDALILTLLAYGIGPGDEVIVPANTYIATALAVSHTGATPIFVEPEEHTYVISLSSLRTIVTEKTKAVIPVHLYGQPVDMLALVQFAEDNDLIVIEDCAQAAGGEFFNRKIGTWGESAAFSFYPTKNLGGLGQGGAVLTNDPDIARTVRELGNVGRSEDSWFFYKHKGFNSRLDAVNAMFLKHCLTMLDDWNAKRRAVAFMYADKLFYVENIKSAPLPTAEYMPVYHLYEIKCPDKNYRDGLKTFLESKGVGCGLHYPMPCHKQPIYDEGQEFPIAEDLSDTLLSIPMHPMLSLEEIDYVVEQIKRFDEGC
jgi:dTDP-4-amino-4,6-dideoxygalactose transaminase